MLFLVLLQLTLALAATITGKYSQLESYDLAGTSVQLRALTLPSEERTVFLSSDGSFELHGVAPGSYELSTSSPTISSGRYSVEVDDDSVIVVRRRRSSGTSGSTVSHPINMEWKRTNIVVDRPAFSLWAMLKSPTVFLSLSSLAMVYALPYISGSIDEETLAEIRNEDEKREKKTAAVAEKLGKIDVAKMMADSRHKA